MGNLLIVSWRDQIEDAGDVFLIGSLYCTCSI